MDQFINTTPFFSSEQRALAERVTQFAAREVEPRAHEDEASLDEHFRSYLSLLVEADLMRFAVAVPGQAFDLRAFCIIREALSYSSSLADLAFVMQGLGTYPISIAASEHVRVGGGRGRRGRIGTDGQAPAARARAHRGRRADRTGRAVWRRFWMSWIESNIWLISV